MVALLGASVTAVGPSGSGKSDLLWSQYTRRAPRVVTLEVVEETLSRDASAVRVYGYDELVDTLRDLVLARSHRWHVVVSLDPDEVSRMFSMLCPELRSAATVSFAKRVGGLVVSCGELAAIAPLGLPKTSPIKSAYLRGRHHWLSIHGAAQHAADCDPVTRMQADRLVFMRAVDDLGLSAVQRATSAAVSDVVAQLPDFHSCTAIRREGKAYLADADYSLYRIMDFRGALLWERPLPISRALARVPEPTHANGKDRPRAGGNRLS